MKPDRPTLFERLGTRWKWWALAFASLLLLVTVVDSLAVIWHQRTIPEPLGYLLVAWLALAVILVTVAGATVWAQHRADERDARLWPYLNSLASQVAGIRGQLDTRAARSAVGHHHAVPETRPPNERIRTTGGAVYTSPRRPPRDAGFETVIRAVEGGWDRMSIDSRPDDDDPTGSMERPPDHN